MMNSRRIRNVILVSLGSGSEKDEDRLKYTLQTAVGYLDAQLEGFDLDSPEAFCDAAVQLACRFESITIAGGDGAVGDVITVLPADSDVVLSHLPLGSGNALLYDLASESRHSLFLDTLVDKDSLIERRASQIANGTVRNLDLVEYTTKDGRTIKGFVAGVGFDAASIRVREGLKQAGAGPIRGYTKAIAGQLKRNSYGPATIIVDGKSQDIGSLVMVGATKLQHHGFGLRVCPEAVLDDGQLYIRTVDGSPYKMAVGLASSSLLGHNLIGKRQSGRTLEVMSDTELPVQLSGTYIEDNKNPKMRVIPKAVRFAF